MCVGIYSYIFFFKCNTRFRASATIEYPRDCIFPWEIFHRDGFPLPSPEGIRL